MYIRTRFYYIVAFIVVVLTLGMWMPWLFVVGKALVGLLALAVLVEIVLLWHHKGITASRSCSSRFSNGDDNEVVLRIDSTYRLPVKLDVIDEIPHVFQRRDILFHMDLSAGSGGNITYKLRPTERGVYSFGRIRVFAFTALGLLMRRYTCGEGIDVAVYPSYLMLNRYELMAMSNNLTELGIKRIRRAGNNTEFEQIKDYVQGDDFRTINWKASARRHQLMVNVYTDEKSQQIFNVIDKGRVMQQAFDGMTLLDYSINAALMLSYVATRKEDKAGIVSFAEEFDTYIPAEKHSGHMQKILEGLYAQETTFGESDFSSLCVNVNRLIGKRSLLVLYTSFSGLTALNRQLPYLHQLNQRHRLLVVFFADSELLEYMSERARNTEEYYQHVVAEKMEYEKRLIVNTLREQGIYALLTTPQNLSVDVLNRYLEMKSRNLF
ncbi:MAG: DUF58 domain-containing protein [Muribaculaceae bacterium]|nr:DUF58 domain-containing protein [Muribaculaceae bacterium]